MEDGYFWVNGKKYKSMHEEVPPITKEMSKEMTIQLGMPYHDLPMFLFDYVITGDAVMMLALTEALIAGYNDLEKTKREIKKSTKKWMSKYPSFDYTSRSPVIISSVAWLYNTPGTVKEYSEICAIEMGYEKEQTKDVIACAEAIFMAKSGTDKNIIKQQLIRKYVLAFNDKTDLEKAIDVFIENEGMDEIITEAAALGDNVAAIAGSIAQGYYNVSYQVAEKTMDMLGSDVELSKLHGNYIRFLLELRNERKAMIEKVTDHTEFFGNCTKTEVITPPPKNDIFCMGYYNYGEEINALINMAYYFADEEYNSTLELFGVEYEMDKFSDYLSNSCPMLQRAILTSIVRNERFCDGIIAEAVEMGIIAALIYVIDVYRWCK